MKIRFVGPLGIVTGSCTWLSHNGTEFLVDCGIEQDHRPAATWTDKPWPFEPSRLSFVVLTHAHADHCGLLPKLYQMGFSGFVYCTQETARIAEVMLRDSAKRDGAGFTSADVDQIKWKEPAGTPLFGRRHPVGTDLFLQFYRSAHVMGAVSVRILWGDFKAGQQRSIAFSGDLGPDAEDHENLPFLRHRMGLDSSDFAVLESTYGGQKRKAGASCREVRQRRLGELIDQVVDSSGTLIIPAFTVGRIQDVLFDIHWLAASDPERFAGVDFRLGAPLAQKLAPIIIDGIERTESNGANGKVRPLWLGKQMFRWLGLDDTDPDDVDRAIDICRMTLGLPTRYHGSEGRGNEVARSWRSLFRPDSDDEGRGTGSPRVFVASSGMGDQGRVASLLPEALTRASTVVAFSGYCAAASIGGQLQSLANTPVSERRRLRGHMTWKDGTSVPLRDIKATIHVLSGYSAHADQPGLVSWVLNSHKGRWNPAGKTIFIQHGEDQARRDLSEAIFKASDGEGLGISCVLPTRDNDTFDLDRIALGRSETRLVPRHEVESVAVSA